MCTGLMKSNLGKVAKDELMLTEEKNEKIKNAIYWARKADTIQICLDPLRETCEACNYLLSKLKELSLI
jgi:hypothetical protein